MKSFKELAGITEDRHSSENGFSASGQTVSVEIKTPHNSSLMKLEVKGSTSLSSLKSSEELKREYREEDWGTIDKIWNSISDEYSKELEKLVIDFEKDINNILKDIEKRLKKF